MGELIRAVTFDLWNTLVDNRNYGGLRVPALGEFLRGYGVELDPARLLELYLSGFMYSSEVQRATGRRHVRTEEIVGHVVEQAGLGVVPDWGPLVRAYEEAALRDPPKLKDGARETLEALHGRVRVGLISDTGTSPGRVIRRILGDHGVLQYFDATVFSDEVGYCKPNEAVFRAALDALCVEPDESLHVGDRVNYDVVGAKRAGMRTAWLKTGEQEYAPDDSPDHVITSLLELIGIVEAGG